MAPQGQYANDELDDSDDELGAEEEDLGDEDDDLPEMACPACGGVVTEDTQKCPQCGNWITPQYPSGRGWRRGLFVAAVILMILALLVWML